MAPEVTEGESRDATRRRHEQLLSLLRDGSGRVEELATQLGVSPSTVRRDLARLGSSGRIARTYGGAITRDAFHERSVGESAGLARQAKASIAAKAAALVTDGTTIFLDAGTTCRALAGLLAGHRNLTVVTRGLEAAVELASAPGVDLTIVGGRVRALSHGLVGPIASATLRRFTFDLVFLGADAVDPVRGIGEPTIEETMLKEDAAAGGRAVYVLADVSKLDCDPPPVWTVLRTGWGLITDPDISEKKTGEFLDNGVSVLVGEPAARSR